MGKFTVKQDAGRNLRTVISKLLVKSPIDAVKELVSNSYDADAEHVHVTVDEGERLITVEDDGSGIAESQLEQFLKMGDSDKIQNPISPKGRGRIGQFGIATVLLEYLGDSYEINTRCGGVHIHGVETFCKKATGGLEYKIVSRNAKNTGTCITIHDAHFIGQEQLPLGRLARALTWEVPILDDFQVYLNNERLVRKNSKPKHEYIFTDILPKAGEVIMKVQYFDSKPIIGGVYVYVDGRSVGDPDDIDLHKVGRSLVHRVFADITANGLKPYISFDRSHFREDNPALRELRDCIYTCLRKVKRHVFEYHATETPAIIATADDARTVLKEAGLMIPGGHGGNGNLLAISGLHTKEMGYEGKQATIEPKTGELFINPEHPWYNSPDITHPDLMKLHTLLGTAFAVAEANYSRNHADAESRSNSFNTLCAKLLGSDDVLSEVQRRASQQDREGMFVPFRRYRISEITAEHIPLITLNKLIEAGVLHEEEGTITGKELNDYMRVSLNYTPAMEAVKQYEEQRLIVRDEEEQHVSKQRVGQLYGRINDILAHYVALLPFMFNVGKTKPFFLVGNEDVPKFMGLYAEGIFKDTPSERHLAEIRPIIERVIGTGEQEDFFDLAGLCQLTRGTPREVFQVITFAQKRGFALPFELRDSSVIYSAHHFKKAREAYLLGETREQ